MSTEISVSPKRKVWVFMLCCDLERHPMYISKVGDENHVDWISTQRQIQSVKMCISQNRNMKFLRCSKSTSVGVDSWRNDRVRKWQKQELCTPIQSPVIACKTNCLLSRSSAVVCHVRNDRQWRSKPPPQTVEITAVSWGEDMISSPRREWSKDTWEIPQAIFRTYVSIHAWLR